jgi:transcriptional regulator with XRE-family HTH domain
MVKGLVEISGFFILEVLMNNLREIRKSKGISQWSLAQRSKVHQSRISLAENGLVELTREEKKRLTDALGVDATEILPKT